MNLLKFACLTAAIAWTFTWIGKVSRGHGVESAHTWCMALSIAGFIFLQFCL